MLHWPVMAGYGSIARQGQWPLTRRQPTTKLKTRQPRAHDCFGATVEMNVGYGATCSTGRSWPVALIGILSLNGSSMMYCVEKLCLFWIVWSEDDAFNVLVCIFTQRHKSHWRKPAITRVPSLFPALLASTISPFAADFAQLPPIGTRPVRQLSRVVAACPF